MKKLLTIIFFFGTFSLAGNAQIKLTYNLTTDTEYSSKLVLDQTISQTMMGQVQAQKNAQGYGIKLMVDNVNEDGYTLTLEYTSIMLKQPMSGIDYDSETDTGQPNPMTQSLGAVVGNGFQIEMDKSGSISSISGFTEMIDNMTSGMDITDDAQLAAIKTQLTSQYNEETSLSQMLRLLVNYPDKMLEKGDTWSADESITLPFPMNVQTSYELADYNDETATINISSDIFTVGEPMNMMGATMTPDLTGTQSGTITIDRKTGYILSSSMEQSISGVMNLTSPQEMVIPIEIDGKTDITGTIK